MKDRNDPIENLADGERPECDVEPPFEKTRAFHWLKKNAARFGYELSFPRNNRRGVNYEPWHWRFNGAPAKPTDLKK